MKRVLLTMSVVLSLGMASPAMADRGYDHGGYEEGCGRGGGGCGNEREENYEGANCKYVCPQFDRSPVQDAFNFNPQVCLPGATCHFEDRQDRNPEQPPEGQQP